MDDTTPTLAPGASFSEINQSAPEPAEAGTSAIDGGAEVSAKDGGETPAELPGVLQENGEAKGGDDEGDTPDLSLDPELEKHPVLKAKWEAYKAQKERGIQQFMEKQKAQAQESAQFKDDWEPLVEHYQRFEQGPEAALAAFKEFGQQLEQHYKVPFLSQAQAHAQTQTITEPDGSKYGLEYQSDDKVVDIVLERVGKLLDDRFGKLDPVIKSHESAQQEAAVSSKANSALAGIQSLYQTSAAPWITGEMVAGAMREFPGLEPLPAFKAKYADEIARYMASNSQALRTPRVKDMVRDETGAKHSESLLPGATFGEINRAASL